MKLIPRSLAIIAGSTLALALQPLQAADVILDGNYLRVGVNNSGSLVDSAFTVGIDYDKTGTNTPTGFDFIKPGTPYEFFGVGYNNASAVYAYWDNTYTTFNGTTTNTSAGSTLSTLTTGAYGEAGALGISQMLSFGMNSGIINFAVSLTNNTAEAMSNVVYARGLDPDQDVYAGGGYPTTNTIVSGNLVTGSAPVTDWTIGIFSDSSYAHTPTVRSSWPIGSSDTYNLLTPRDDGYGDYSINMAWNVGTLGAGATAVVTFQYRIAETKGEVVTPRDTGGGVPDTTSTLAVLGVTLLSLAGLRRKISA
jgi:hypothetical protein